MNQIVLIGGPPGAGKTTLAQRLAAHLGRKTISMDDLVTAARAVASSESHPALYPAAGAGHHEYFTNTAPEQLIADAERLATASWPIAERVIRAHQASQTGLILDYWLFEPETVAHLDPAVGAIWLHIDPTALDGRERANDWTDGSSDPDRMHRNFMARSLWRNAYLAEKAALVNHPVLRLTGDETPEETLAKALDLME